MYLLEELLEGHLSLGDEDDVADERLVALDVDVPHLAQRQIREDPVDAQQLHQLLPVALLQRVRLQLRHQDVDFAVRLQHLAHVLERGVLTQTRRQLLHLSQQVVDLLAQLPRLHRQPRLLLHLVDLLPNVAQLRPHAFQIVQFLVGHLIANSNAFLKLIT